MLLGYISNIINKDCFSMNIKSIDHIVITANNVEGCVKFYTEILGMKLDMTNDRVAVTFGCQKINIHRKKAEFTPAAKNITYGSVDICLIADGEIDEIVEELINKNVEIELGIVPRTGAVGPIQSIYLRDPDENLIEISTYS